MQPISRTFASATSILLVISFASQTLAEVSIPVHKFISPAENEGVEGAGAVTPKVASRTQEIHSAAGFPLLADTIQPFEIFEVRLRPDGELMAPESVTFPYLRLTLAVAPFEGLKLDFEANLDDSIDPTVVFEGPITFTTQNSRLPDGPMDFDQTIPLQTPFPYSPNRGNLLVDIDVFEPDVPPLFDFAFGSVAYIQQVPGTGVEPREDWSLPLQLSLRPVLNGDFDGSGVLDAADMDLLSAAAGTVAPLLDVNQDGSTNEMDRQLWISDLAKTFPGDANLDGSVEFEDFLALSGSFGLDGGWSVGDFDGNAKIDFADFLVLSQNFGAQRPAVAAVPEPNSQLVMAIAALSLILIRRRYC